MPPRAEAGPCSCHQLSLAQLAGAPGLSQGGGFGSGFVMGASTAKFCLLWGRVPERDTWLSLELLDVSTEESEFAVGQSENPRD